MKGDASSLFLSRDDLLREGVTILFRDPNFDNENFHQFKGVPLCFLLSMAGISVADVTLVGRDQYSVHLPLKMVKDPRVALAVKRNGKFLAPFEGGPVKLMIPPEYGLPFSAYCWYVEALVQKEEARDFSLFLPMPDGYCVGGKGPCQPPGVQAVPLDSLFDEGAFKGRHLTFVPHVGRSMTLSGDDVSGRGLLVIFSLDGRPLPFYFGGPFSIYFPVLHDASLGAMAPDSGGLFF